MDRAVNVGLILSLIWKRNGKHSGQVLCLYTIPTIRLVKPRVTVENFSQLDSNRMPPQYRYEVLNVIKWIVKYGF